MTTALHTMALDILLHGCMAEVAVARDWELLRAVAALAESDAPLELATTDPALYASWRKSVTMYHLNGWGNMTPSRIDEVYVRNQARLSGRAAPPAP